MYGEPAACRAAALDGRRVATRVGDAVSRVRRAGSSSSAAWEGIAGDQFRGALSDAKRQLDDLRQRITPACSALDTFADELDVVNNDLADVRGIAAAAGLATAGDTISPPAAVGGHLDQAQADAYDAKVKAYNRALQQAEAARSKEREAHARLGSAMTTSSGDGWLENLLQKLGFAPPEGNDAVDGAAWALGLGGLSFGVASSTMLKGVLQVFQPRSAGQWASLTGMSFWQRLAAAGKGDSWRAKAYQAATRDRWATAGKWSTRVGTVVTAGTSAWDQWKADADNPSLDQGERVDRAATKGASTAAGAYVGAEAGAWAGGAIGTAICPGVGTVVGGAVGGLVGGFAGSSAGGWVGDQLNNAYDGVGHAAADAVHTLGDAAGDVGDAISFWD